jgi:hypothetical protein
MAPDSAGVADLPAEDAARILHRHRRCLDWRSRDLLAVALTVRWS